VILINLLPHREMARKRAKSAYNVLLLLAAVVGAAIAVLIYLGYEAAIVEQDARNEFLKSQNAKLDAQIKDVDSLQSEIAGLKARQEAVESLQANRNLPVHMLNAAVEQLPEGLYLSGIKQDGQNVLLTGVAQSQERISELLRNLSDSNSSQWLTHPELVEIQSTELTLGAHEQRRVYNFTVRTVLPGSSSAASAPPGAAKKHKGA
jgi:type IV pilus assembly protein PilN